MAKRRPPHTPILRLNDSPETDEIQGLDSQFWGDLIGSISDGLVIPVIGQGVVTFGEHDTPLYPWLAKQVAKEPDMQCIGIPPNPSLNDVAVSHFKGQPNANDPYTATARVLSREKLSPGRLLKDLASITKFDFFLSTAVDTLLEEALNEVRFDGQAKLDNLFRCFPDELPGGKESLNGPLVYKLLGRVTRVRNWVLWEGDLLERLLELNAHLQQVNYLSKDLEKNGLLLIGLGFSDWVTRLFMRFAQGQPGRRPPVTTPVLADASTSSSAVQRCMHCGNSVTGHVPVGNEPLVMYFRESTQSLKVVRCCPMKFTRTLTQKWKSTHNGDSETMLATRPISETMNRGAIFVSYAREDDASARRIVAKLQAAGCDVWFDRERLKPGQYWPDELEDEVMIRSGLFLSVISKTTESEPTGYFHQERNWATDRCGRISRGEDRSGTEFYIPVVIDDSPLSPKREPKTLKIVQAFKAEKGDLPESVVAHLKELQDKYLQSIRKTP